MPERLTDARIEELLVMGDRIAADDQQNNHCTADPIFVVQQKHRTYGMDSSIDDVSIAWLYEDECDEVSDADLAPIVEEYERTGKEPKGYRRVAYVESWEFVQPFFTRESADLYIQSNSHRMNEPRVYVECAYRNYEWQAVRNSIRSLLEEVRTQRQFQSELVSALRDCASAMESHRGKIPLCFPWEKFINPAKHLIARAEKEGRNR